MGYFCFQGKYELTKAERISSLLPSLPAPAWHKTPRPIRKPLPQQSRNPPERRCSKGRADAHFNYTMGHIAEKQYEETSRSEYATQAIEYYKKAYALDPKSPVIGERLAEMYWKRSAFMKPNWKRRLC